MGNIFCACFFFQQVRNIHRVNYKSIHFYICIKKNRDGVDVKETTSPKLTDQKRDIWMSPHDLNKIGNPAPCNES